MKFILSTCVLFLVLPWKLSSETTVKPIRTMQETTSRGDEHTIFSTKDPLKPSGETAHSSAQSSTGLDESTSKDQETTTRGDGPTFFTKNREEQTTEKNKNVLFSKSHPQTTALTSMSHAEHLATATTTYRGESRLDSLQSSTPFIELTQKQTLTTQNIIKEDMTTKDEHLTLYHLKSTNKGLDRHTQRKKTTRSADESFMTKNDISTHFQKPPEIITNHSAQTTETLTTMSSISQEKHQPILNITVSNGPMNVSNEERNDTATYPLNTSTTTRFSTGLSPTVNTEVATTGTTETMGAKTTYEMPTKAITRKEKNPTSNIKTTSTTSIDTIQTTKPSTTFKDNNKSNPGPIVASLIGSIIFLMFIAFVAVWVKNLQKKKKQTENSDWAGPSPFIEADIHPNLPTVSEDGPYQGRETKRISLYTFLPQQLSKRFSMLSPTDEEVPLESTLVSSTFGQHNAQPLNGTATPDPIQTPEANSPPAELSSNSDVPKTVNIPQTPENKETVQTTTKLDEEITPSPLTETNSDTLTPFEEVDLNLSQEQNTETTTPSDDTNIPSPSPP